MSNKPAGQVSRTASQSLLEKFENLKGTEAFLAVTGRGDTAKTVLVPNRAGFIFVRVPKLIEDGEITEFSEAQAFSAIGEFRHGVPVLVTRSESNISQYEIKEVWTVGIGQAAIEAVSGSINLHHNSHEIYSPAGGHDPVMVDTAQLRNMQVSPTKPASSRVKVGAGWYQWSDGVIHFYDGTEVELSGRVPSGTLSLNYVSLSLNHETQDIEFIERQTVNSVGLLGELEDLIVWPQTGRIPLAGIRLKGAVYQIGWAEDGIPVIIDMRPHQALLPAETRILASGTLSTIEEDYISVGVNPSVLNFLGNMFKVEQEGTSGRVTVTGTLDLEEDDVFKVAADTVNFEGDGAFLDFNVIDEGARKGTVSGTFDETQIRHEALNFLGVDDHSQYALLAGRVGGQVLSGGTASGDDLTLQSTSNGTKGSIILGTTSEYDEVNDRLGLGVLSPGAKLDVLIGATTEIGIIVQAAAGQTANMQEWQDSAGAVMSFIDETGRIRADLDTLANNVFIGHLTGNPAATGGTNVGIGENALKSVTTGNANMAIGTGASQFLTDAIANVMLGFQAGRWNTGSGNVGIGSLALNGVTGLSTGGNNMALGQGALEKLTTGTDNAAIGRQVLKQVTTGVQNIAIGNTAGRELVGGDNNVFLGFGAGENETGSDNLYIHSNNTATPLIKGDFAGTGGVTIHAQITTANALNVKGMASQSGSLLRLLESDDSIFVSSGDGLGGSEFVINEQGEDIDFRVEGDTDINLLHADASVDAVGVGIALPLAKLHVDQPSTTGAKPVITLDQADVDEDFFKFIGTSDTSVDRALVDAANFTTPGAIVGWLKINIQDDQGTAPITDGDYYIPFHAAPTA